MLCLSKSDISQKHTVGILSSTVSAAIGARIQYVPIGVLDCRGLADLFCNEFYSILTVYLLLFLKHASVLKDWYLLLTASQNEIKHTESMWIVCRWSEMSVMSDYITYQHGLGSTGPKNVRYKWWAIIPALPLLWWFIFK